MVNLLVLRIEQKSHDKSYSEQIPRLKNLFQTNTLPKVAFLTSNSKQINAWIQIA